MEQDPGDSASRACSDNHDLCSWSIGRPQIECKEICYLERMGDAAGVARTLTGKKSKDDDKETLAKVAIRFYGIPLP